MNKNRKVIIFLGLNGVTKPVSSSDLFDGACMYWLRRLLEKNQFLDIVLTSSWSDYKSLEEAIKMLGKNLGSYVSNRVTKMDDSK